MESLDAGAVLELVERARARDEAAFTMLVRPRLEPLLRVATAIVGSEFEARDALQAALAASWANLPKLRDPDRFEAWITRILVNECRAVLRRTARARVRELRMDTIAQPDARPALQVGGPEATLADRLALERAFERLPADARALLVLHHLEQLPVGAIAEVLVIPPGTVKSRLHAARKALERELEKET